MGFADRDSNQKVSLDYQNPGDVFSDNSPYEFRIGLYVKSAGILWKHLWFFLKINANIKR
jgi:hypothetical protein